MDRLDSVLLVISYYNHTSGGSYYGTPQIIVIMDSLTSLVNLAACFELSVEAGTIG